MFFVSGSLPHHLKQLCNKSLSKRKGKLGKENWGRVIRRYPDYSFLIIYLLPLFLLKNTLIQLETLYHQVAQSTHRGHRLYDPKLGSAFVIAPPAEPFGFRSSASFLELASSTISNRTKSNHLDHSPANSQALSSTTA